VHGRDVTAADVGDDRVELVRGGERLRNRLAVGGVADDRRQAVAGRDVVDVDGDDPCALREEPLDRRAPDARRTTRDERDPAVEEPALSRGRNRFLRGSRRRRA
jgi:hypothetical protein